MTRNALVCLTLVAAFATVASGDVMVLGPAVPLSDLIGANEPLIVGGKRFENFFYSATGDMAAAESVNVIPINSDGNYGVRFQGGFVDLPGDSASDALLTFTVSATETHRLISNAHLGGNVDLLNGVGLGSVTETFLPDFPRQMLSIFDDGNNVQLSNQVEFPTPAPRVSVQKNIILFAGQGSAGATMSFVDQTFSEIITPEPSEVALLLMAAAGLVVLRARR